MTRMRSQVRILYRPSVHYEDMCIRLHLVANYLDFRGFRDQRAIRCNFLPEPAGPHFGPRLGRILSRLRFRLRHAGGPCLDR